VLQRQQHAAYEEGNLLKIYFVINVFSISLPALIVNIHSGFLNQIPHDCLASSEIICLYLLYKKEMIKSSIPNETNTTVFASVSRCEIS
jgi:hypothetical protein